MNSDGQTKPKRGRPKGQQRGPNTKSVNAYLATPQQAFISSLEDKGIKVWDDVTGQGVFVAPFQAKSNRTESGYDMALIVCPIFMADRSRCCKDNVIDGKCAACGNACDVDQIMVRRPTYQINPRTKQRYADWAQCIIPQSVMKGAGEAILKLAGVVVEEKKELIKEDESLSLDKRMRDLIGYGL